MKISYVKSILNFRPCFASFVPLPLCSATSARMIDTKPSRGSITCIIGPMFSGKTTELLRLHDRQIIAKRNCVLVKYAGDTRYDSDLVATHSKVVGRGSTVKAHRLAEVHDKLFDPQVQVVSIDEGQFFDDLADTCEALANSGKLVYVAALNGTFERKSFPQITLLLPYCEEIKQVVAVCMGCGADACYTFRNTKDKKVEVIGGQDKYQALCRHCYCTESEKRDIDDVILAGAAVSENEKTAGPIPYAKPCCDGDMGGDGGMPRKILALNRTMSHNI